MRIRSATIEDAGILSRILSICWPIAYAGLVPEPYLAAVSKETGPWKKVFYSGLLSGGLFAQILYNGRMPVGCISYGPYRRTSRSGAGEIMTLYVLPGHTGRGFGSALLQAALEDMRKHAFSTFYIWVFRENMAARHFYEKHGFFSVEGERTVTIAEKRLIETLYFHA